MIDEIWHVIDTGTRPNEKIVAILNEDGTYHTVASAFLDRKGWIYNLYPVAYGYAYSIKSHIKVSIYNVRERN